MESESKLQHTENLIAELLEGNEKIITMDFTALVWAKSSEELELKCDELLQAYREMGQSEGLLETWPAFEAFISALPGAVTPFRAKRLKSSNVAHLLPVYAPWRGNTRPVCLFDHAHGGICKFDPFPPEMLAWNALIFASTGAGKSFAILQMALQFYGQHPTPRIVWIDNGASSERA